MDPGYSGDTQVQSQLVNATQHGRRLHDTSTPTRPPDKDDSKFLKHRAHGVAPRAVSVSATRAASS